MAQRAEVGNAGSHPVDDDEWSIDAMDSAMTPANHAKTAAFNAICEAEVKTRPMSPASYRT